MKNGTNQASRRRGWTLAIALLLPAAVVPQAKAGPLTILSNLSSGGNIGLLFGGGDELAVGFTMTGNYDLDSITLKLNFPNGATSSDANVYLFSDIGGQPGSMLDTLTYDSGNTLTKAAALYQYDAPPLVDLNTGSTYWVVLEFTPDTNLDWVGANPKNPYVSTGATFVNTMSNAGGSWSTLNDPSPHTSDVATPFLELDGPDPSATPEPATFGLIGAGLVGLALAARRKRPAA